MIPGPPHPTGAPLNYGELFTLKDYLEVLEQAAPETAYENALAFLDNLVLAGTFEVFSMTEDARWIYRFVPPEERLVTVVVYQPKRSV